MSNLSKKPVSSFTIVAALTTKPLSYRNHLGKDIEVAKGTYIYVDTAAGVALVGRDHIEIFVDEYSPVAQFS